MLMNAKILGTIGLVLLILSRILLAQGFDFLQAQRPLDFAHWFMLLGALLMIPLNSIFPRSLLNTILTPMVYLGVAAHIGMCTIDFMVWSYGEDLEAKKAFITHLIGSPSLSVPFLMVGPALLYASLGTQALYFIRSHTLPALVAMVGSTLIGLGQVIWKSQTLVLIGYFLFAMGLIVLAFRKEPVQTKKVAA